MHVDEDMLTSEENFLKELARAVSWDIAYHERELFKAHQHMAAVLSLFALANVSPENDKADQSFADNDDDGDFTGRGGLEYLYYILGNARHSVEYHDKELKKAHRATARFKIIFPKMAGDKFVIDWDKIDQAARKQLDG